MLKIKEKVTDGEYPEKWKRKKGRAKEEKRQLLCVSPSFGGMVTKGRGLDAR